MDELYLFVREKAPSKYDLLKIALVHHRFLWIHPFKNGNGRTVRLLNYALFLHQGFNLSEGRLINPTVLFCKDRDAYYAYLSGADGGDPEKLLKRCQYVLSGLKTEIKKIDQLLDFDFLAKKILAPATDLWPSKIDPPKSLEVAL